MEEFFRSQKWDSYREGVVLPLFSSQSLSLLTSGMDYATGRCPTDAIITPWAFQLQNHRPKHLTSFSMSFAFFWFYELPNVWHSAIGTPQHTSVLLSKKEMDHVRNTGRVNMNNLQEQLNMNCTIKRLNETRKLFCCCLQLWLWHRIQYISLELFGRFMH